MASGILLALALAAGIVDAATYLALGHVFTANMTGNTVLLGIAAVQGDGAQAVRSAAALGGFSVGVAAGIALIRSNAGWPSRAVGVLCVESLLLAFLVALWSATGAKGDRLLLVAISGLAMGAQSAAVRSSDVRGVNTTYMTSTLINAIARVITRLRARPEASGRPELPASAWAIYAVGALIGAAAENAWAAGVMALPLVIVATTSLVAAGGLGRN